MATIKRSRVYLLLSIDDMTTVYLNGKFLPLEKAKISVMDRGFLFGDGVYEVIPVYNSHLCRLKEHLTRLRNSLDAIQLAISMTNEALEAIFQTCIKYSGGGDQSLYVQCTRGLAPNRDHLFPQEVHPTIFIYSTPIIPKTVEELSRGISVITLPNTRWRLAEIKAITLLANVLLRQEASAKQSSEAILIEDSYALEGTASNLFIVKEGRIITPPLSPLILNGITRDLVMELATQHGETVEQQTISVEALQTADEIWLTSSIREVVPVIRLNGKPVGSGIAGQCWHKMIKYYQIFKQSFYV